MPVNIIERNSSLCDILQEYGHLTSNIYPSRKEAVFHKYLYDIKETGQLDIHPTWGVYQNVTSTPVMWASNSTEEEDIIENDIPKLPMLSEPGSIKRTSSLRSHSYYNCLQVYNKYTEYDSEQFDYKDKLVVWQIYGKHLREVKFHLDVATSLQLHIFSRRLTFPSFNLSGGCNPKTKDSLKRLESMLSFHDNLVNESFIRGKIRVCLALEYARKNKLGKAHKYLEQAGEYLAQTEASEFRAWYHLASASIYNSLRKVSQSSSTNRLPVVFKHLENARNDFLKECENGSCFQLESVLVLWWMFIVKSGLVDLVTLNCNLKKKDLEELKDKVIPPTDEDITEALNLYKCFKSEVKEIGVLQTQEMDEFHENMSSVLRDLKALVNPETKRARKQSGEYLQDRNPIEDKTMLLPDLGTDTSTNELETSDFSANDVVVSSTKTKKTRRRHHHTYTTEEMMAEFKTETTRHNIPEYIYFHHLGGKFINLVVQEGTTDQTVSYLKVACPTLYDLGLIKITEQTFNWAANENEGNKRNDATPHNHDKVSGTLSSIGDQNVQSVHLHAAGDFTNRCVYGQKTTVLSPGSEFFPVPSKDVVNVICSGQVHVEMDINRKLGVKVSHYGTIGCFTMDEKKGKLYAITSQHNIDKCKYGYQEVEEDGARDQKAKIQTTWMSQINNEIDPMRNNCPDVFILGTKVCGILCDKQSFLGSKDVNPERTSRVRRHSCSSKTPMVYDIAAIEMDDTLHTKEYFQPFLNTMGQNIQFVMPQPNTISVNTKVQKKGAKTGLTSGYICSTDIHWNNESNWYGGCFMITSDADAEGNQDQIAFYGDSGAIVSTQVGDDQSKAEALGIIHKVDNQGKYAVCVNLKINLEELNKQSGSNFELVSHESLEKFINMPNVGTTKVNEVGLTDSGFCDTDASVTDVTLPSSGLDDSASGVM